MSSLSDCERQAPLAYEVNARAPQRLAEAVPTILVSTDQVFGGDAAPYEVVAATDPRNTYGRTKAEAEENVLEAGGSVARLPLLFGPSEDGSRGATDMLRRAHCPVSLFANETRTPLHVADAARGLIDLCCGFAPGSVHHLASPERVTRYELGEMFVAATGVDVSIKAATNSDESRPEDVSLVPTWTPGRSLCQALAES